MPSPFQKRISLVASAPDRGSSALPLLLVSAGKVLPVFIDLPSILSVGPLPDLQTKPTALRNDFRLPDAVRTPAVV